MANELRVYANWVGGLVEDNPLASGATTLTSAGLAALPAIGSTQHILICFDPDGLTGAPFIKRCTAHTAAATTCTIEAAAVIGTARAIDRDVPWTTTIVDTDVRAMRVWSASVYRNVDQTGIADATWTDIDFDTEYWDDLGAFDLTANTFTAPGAGRIRVSACADWSSVAPTASYLRVNKNAGTIIAYEGGGTDMRRSITTGWRPCAASDTFKIQVFIDVAAGTSTLEGDANGITSASFEYIADA